MYGCLNLAVSNSEHTDAEKLAPRGSGDIYFFCFSSAAILPLY